MFILRILAYKELYAQKTPEGINLFLFFPKKFTRILMLLHDAFFIASFCIKCKERWLSEIKIVSLFILHSAYIIFARKSEDRMRLDFHYLYKKIIGHLLYK